MPFRYRLSVAIVFSALLALLVPAFSPALAQWPSDPAQNLSIADRPSEQVTPKIAVTPDGGCYVVWFDLASGNYDVYLQRLSLAGVEQWPHNGILVSNHPQNSSLVDWDLICDANGNAVVTFTDARAGSDLDVYAYKVSSDGTMLWGADGVTLSDNSDYEVEPKVAQATDGDFVFVWPRLPDAGSGRIMMQRLSPDGVARFAFGGIEIAGEGTESPGFSDIVPAENGSVIVSWVRDISLFTSPRYIRASKFLADGTNVWGGYVSVYDAVPVPLGYAPTLQPDGAGGALFWWHRASGNVYNCLVQHLDVSGTEIFPHNGVTVSTDTANNHIDPTLSFRQATGEIFVFWNERNSAQSQWGIYGQKFSPAGTRLWGNTGVVILPVNSTYKSYPRSVPYADGAMVFLFDEPTGQFGMDRVIAFRIDNSGQSVWAQSPLVVSSTLSAKGRLPVVINNSGMAVAIWEDNRAGSVDVYGQNVWPDGTLGINPAAAPVPAVADLGAIRLSPARPNPASGSTTIGLSLGRDVAGARLAIFDADGRLVRGLRLGYLGAGAHSIRWDLRNGFDRPVTGGVYLYRLLLPNGESAGGRVTVLP